MPCPTERVGKCGEHLTASFLYLFGSDLVTMPHGSHADIVFEYKNILYKCQVKTVTKKKKYISKHNGRHYRTGWCWDIRRGGNTKQRRYGTKGTHNIDLYALVCLPYKNIIFVPFLKKTRITFNDDEVKNANSKETLKYTLNLIKQDQLVS